MLQIKKVVTLILFLTLATGFAQKKIRGKVIDADNGAILTDVHIINDQYDDVVISNALGEFELNAIGLYKFTRLGYASYEVEVGNNDFIVIQLKVKSSELNEVIVSTDQLPITLKNSVSTLDVLSAKEINRSNTINFTSIFNRVPGVYMQTGALNTNRITIRGIGSRNLFGTSKIRAYYEDIPLTTGNGETTIEDFEINSIGRIEILRGTVSSIYGAGLGGTIHLKPEKPYFNKTTIGNEFMFGSYGLAKGLINVSHGGAKNNLRAIYSNTHSDGYRDNNSYNRQTLTLVSNHYLNKKNEMSFIGSYIDLRAFIPSSINEDDFINNPTAAAFTWDRSQGFEDTKRGIFGVSWKHLYSDNLKQNTSVFTSFRDAYEPRPFNILTEDTFAFGIRSRFVGNALLLKKKLDWTIGGEMFRDNHQLRTFANLYKDFPIGTGSVQGSLLSSFKEKRNYFNLFFESNYYLSNKTMLSLGLNYNRTSYDLDDRFLAVDKPDQSGRYSFDGIFSPKLGLSHSFFDSLIIYGNIGHGFSPPSISETLLPDGLINTEIEPESGWNFEIGIRGNMINNRLQLNAAIFRLDVRNLLVARRTGQDQFIGVNAGKTIHDGFELALNYQLIKSEVTSLNTYFNYTLNDFRFKEFIDVDQDYSGNDLTGVPSQIFNTGFDIETDFGLYGNVNFQHIGSMPITDSNNLFTDSYNLTNLKVGYQLKLNKSLVSNIFFGLNNIFNEVYASQVLINASSFGGNAPRYFYPGNPLNYYGGINIKYIF